MIERVNKTRAETIRIRKQAKLVNKTVVTYNDVFTNIYNYTHDSNCFTKDASFLYSRDPRKLSYYFNFYFPKTPHVFTTISGVNLKKYKANTDILSLREVEKDEIFNDHFTLSLRINTGKTNYTMLRICYYATVNVLDYIP